MNGPKSWHLRKAQAEDFPFYRKVHEITLRKYVEQIWGWNDAEQLALLKERFNPSMMEIILHQGVDVGILQVESRADEVFLGNILILPERQNQEIGSQLISDIAQRAAPLPVVLSVLEPNPAKTLYERLGFKVTLHEPGRFHMRLETSRWVSLQNPKL